MKLIVNLIIGVLFFAGAFLLPTRASIPTTAAGAGFKNHSWWCHFDHVAMDCYFNANTCYCYQVYAK